eukprot:gene23459-28400_t
MTKSMRFRGCIYADPPRKRDGVRDITEITLEELQALDLIGLPVCVEHGGPQRGVIEAQHTDPVTGYTTVDYRLYSDVAGETLATLTKQGRLRDLSLCHNIYPDPDRPMAEWEKEPVEVSLCMQGGRPGTHIFRVEMSGKRPRRRANNSTVVLNKVQSLYGDLVDLKRKNADLERRFGEEDQKKKSEASDMAREIVKVQREEYRMYSINMLQGIRDPDTGKVKYEYGTVHELTPSTDRMHKYHYVTVRIPRAKQMAMHKFLMSQMGAPFNFLGYGLNYTTACKFGQTYGKKINVSKKHRYTCAELVWAALQIGELEDTDEVTCRRMSPNSIYDFTRASPFCSSAPNPFART